MYGHSWKMGRAEASHECARRTASTLLFCSSPQRIVTSIRRKKNVFELKVQQYRSKNYRQSFPPCHAS
ncbi:unnamed protein product [Calypogeia fissa]